MALATRSLGLFVVALVVAGYPCAARAEDDKEKARPHVMQEPGDVTDVIDAFDSDNGDPFDFSFSLSYNYLSKRARILRETAIFAPGLTTGGFTSRSMNVGRFIETTSILTPRIDIGLYKDLALYSRVPIIVADEQRIDPIDGTDEPAKLATVAAGAPGEGPLFQLPFRSPKRSGVQYIAIGVDFSIFNQARDVTKPTWVIGLETRISAGSPMHACDANKEPNCTHPGDINRNGQFDPPAAGAKTLESTEASIRSPGVTRGTVALEAHSAISKRIKYIEPYGGLSALFEFQQGAESDYGATDFQGALVNHPPIVGNLMLGMMIHPWENREKFGRLTFDVRFEGAYHSEGRDYSEMYDALGASAAKSLRDPKWARFRGCEKADGCTGETVSVVDEGAQKTYFTGLSVVEPYGSYRASGQVTWRIAEYVKLNFGLGLRFDQAHGISHDQPCNPAFKDKPLESGPCHFTAGQNEIGATGIPNPDYRPTINAVGRRFFVDQSTTYEVFAKGVVMF